VLLQTAKENIISLSVVANRQGFFLKKINIFYEFIK